MEMEIRSETAPLVLGWLGTPLASYAGQPLPFRTRKALALLVYLTTEGESHTREKLATLFWPESDSARGRGMLRTTLAHLRAAVSSLDTSKPYLDIGPQTLGFNFDSDFELDLLDIQVGLDALQNEPLARGPNIGVLERAVQAYRGDFLEGFLLADAPAFDDWITLQREIWHNRMTAIFDTLAQWQFEAGDLTAALETAARWQAHDLHGEAAPQRLMQLHFANRNRSAALEIYDRYAKLLDDEFGDKPSAELRALAARIRSRAQARPQREEPPQGLTAADLSFVGRQEELAHLCAAYQGASRGRTQATIVLGEAGIGKTRLVAEFLRWAHAQGADVLLGRAFETGGEVPYQPVAHLLRQRLEQETDPALLLSTTWLAELSRLLPELRDRYPDLPLPLPDEATAQSRLLESIYRLGEALAARAPLVIILDDAQWADIPSLDALHYALLKWTEKQAPILLLLCAREFVSNVEGSLPHWYSGFKAKSAVTQIALTPLTVDDTIAFISTLEGSPSFPPGNGPAGQAAALWFKDFAQALFAETGGQPLYLVETIKALLEQEILIPHSPSDGAEAIEWRTLAGESSGQFPLPRIIPNSVREAIMDRLSRVTPQAHAMLVAAAVIGQGATFEQIIATAGLDQLQGLDALEELVAKRLLIEMDDTSAAYVLAHDTMREVIYRESSTARRQVLHSRALKAIVGGDPARLAYHALAADMKAEALEYSMIAGDAAFRLFAAGDAIAHYEMARRMLSSGRVSSLVPEQIQHLYLNLGRAMELKGEFEEAEAVYAELEAAAHERSAPRLKLAALVARVTLWSALSHTHRLTQGETLAQETLQLARDLGDPVAEVQCMRSIMNFLAYALRLDEAIVTGHQALALGRDLNLREEMALILTELPKCYILSGDLQRASQIQQEANAVWRELNNLPRLADGLMTLVIAARWAGEYDQVLALSADAYQISTSIANTWGQSFSHVFTGYVYWERGDPEQAITVMKESIRLAEEADFLMPQVLVGAELGALYASLGDAQRGLEIVRATLKLADAHLPTFRDYVVGLLARLYVRQGQCREAKSLVEQAVQGMKQHQASFVFQWVRLAEAELALAQGEPEVALTVADTILLAVQQSGMRSVMAPVLYVKAQAFTVTGDTEAARTMFREAQFEAEKLGSRRMLVQIFVALAELEDNPEQAAGLRRQAEEIVEYIRLHTPLDLRVSFDDFLQA